MSSLLKQINKSIKKSGKQSKCKYQFVYLCLNWRLISDNLNLSPDEIETGRDITTKALPQGLSSNTAGTTRYKLP